MTLSRKRAFVSPEPGEGWQDLAARVLPDVPAAEAVQRLQSWNLHLFARIPPGQFTGSDVIFVEPPREGDTEPMIPSLSVGEGAVGG